jgi:hypothetical protein
MFSIQVCRAGGGGRAGDEGASDDGGDGGITAAAGARVRRRMPTRGAAGRGRGASQRGTRGVPTAGGERGVALQRRHGTAPQPAPLAMGASLRAVRAVVCMGAVGGWRGGHLGEGHELGDEGLQVVDLAARGRRPLALAGG